MGFFFNNNKKSSSGGGTTDDDDLYGKNDSTFSIGSSDDGDGHGEYNEGGSSSSTKKKKKSDDDVVFEGQEKQNQAVTGSRILFFLVIAAAAAALASVVFVVLKNEEADDFEAKLDNLGNEFILLSNQNAKTVLGILQGLSASATAQIKMNHQGQGESSSATNNNNNEYPLSFLTMPDVESQLGLARNSTGALVVAYMPVVEPQDYNKWIEYASNNKGWIQEGNPDVEDIEIFDDIWEWRSTETRRLIEEDPCGAKFGERRDRELASSSGEKYRSPVNLTEVEADGGVLAPVWTMSPIPKVKEGGEPTGAINFNLLSKGIYKKAVEFTTYSRLPSFLDVCYQANWFDVENDKSVLQTVIASPVFANYETNSQVVGHVVSVVPWVQFFINNLVEGSEELMVVISNTCNEVFSFRIQGRNATFLAEEDLHNPKYDALAIEAPFADTYNPANLPEGEAPSDYCIYTMTVYPTETFEEEYTTNQPLYYSLIVLAIFFFTSMAFLLFDCLVTRRQGRLMTTARKQNAIVSSLYPKNIKDQLMEEADEHGTSSKRKGGVSGAGRADIKNFLIEDQPKDKGLDAVDSRKKSKPIAERFPDVTIMFGDIAGFTKWSSQREPSDVFTLLEAIYAEYDAIAKRMKVYKVEVVGDCYVAVCGLPDPRKNHAVIMARFAAECLQVMGQLTKSLEEELGPDTSNLSFRVGLHSGSVIAGVLRGDKPRFQLFGDTMNTASRMESTGVPNRVQISPTTADLLIKAGRTSWLVPREDKIQAKGKGEMSTYFLRMKEATTITNTSIDASESSHDIQPVPVAVPPRLNHLSEEFA